MIINEIDKIKYNDNEYYMIFDINVIEQVQKEYGTITKLFELLDSEKEWAKTVKFLVFIMINESIDALNENSSEKMRRITENEAGRIASAKYQLDSRLKIYDLTNKIMMTLISEETIEKANKEKN